MKKVVSANLEDVTQIIVGASALSVPIAFSEESWRLSESLGVVNIIFLVLISFAFISLYSYQSIFQSNIKERYLEYFLRSIFIYLITLFVVSVILMTLDKFPILSDFETSMKRLIIISFPASMGGVVIDGFDKE